eukprot:450090-Prymnesium_polylepis.2
MRDLVLSLARPSISARTIPRLAISDGNAHRLVDESWESLVERLPARQNRLVTYSRKVFIPLTRLCQDSCGYCTFAQHGGVPRGQSAFLRPDEVIEIARQGAATGCTEALFTLGDRPEVKWPAAREHLAELGYESTIDYLAAMCKVAAPPAHAHTCTHAHTHTVPPFVEPAPRRLQPAHTRAHVHTPCGRSGCSPRRVCCRTPTWAC